MTDEQQLKLQAFLDGELPERDTREVAAWLAGDAEATALLGELRNTRKALGDFEPDVRLPETREFYWSKIQREIERSAPASATVKTPSVFTVLRRVLIPVGAMAALALVGFFTLHQLGGSGAPVVRPSAVLADAGAFTYRDQAQGMTVVWLSYPAEKQLAGGPSSATLPAK